MLFLKVLNMSITASWLVLAVFLLRLLFRKSPKALHVVMWALVGLRLVCPFSIESAFSLIPSVETIPQEIITDHSFNVQTGISFVDEQANEFLGDRYYEGVTVAEGTGMKLTALLTILWLIGMATMLAYGVFSYMRLRRRVAESIPMQGNLRLCDRIDSPFILGIVRPQIYLPSALRSEDREFVIAHETAHLKRYDHLWKPLGFALLTVYWFNPVLWLAYHFLCRDIELACDERVIRDMELPEKKAYSTALVNCSVSRNLILSCPLAFGEVGVKARVKNVLHYQKPAFWVLCAAIAAIGIAAVCLLTNPIIPDDRLKVFIDCEIVSHHQSMHSTDNYASVDWEVLSNKKIGNKTTLYLWVLYQEYSYDGGLVLESGAHIPTVITVEKRDGNYHLVEYWEPRDGSDYAKDIREKFPFFLWRNALDSQKYIASQKEKCERMALEYFASESAVGGADAPDNVQINDHLESLRQEYPQYFGLPTAKGLEVYIWQMAPDSYQCALLPRRNLKYTDTELMRQTPVPIERMRAIVDSYGLPESEVTVHAWQNPYSSYYYEVNEEYREELREKFRSIHPVTPSYENYPLIYDSAVADIDDDGKDELCTLRVGLTSGLFTFRLVIQDAQDSTVKDSFTYYPLKVGEPSFEKDPDGSLRIRFVSSEDGAVEYFEITPDNMGNNLKN